MEGVVYLLAAATALACGLLLLRGFARSRARLLLWCGLFFLTLVVENVVLFIDIVVVPETDLSAARTVPAFVGTVLLMYGLIWDGKEGR